MSLADLPLFLHDQPLDDMTLLRMYADDKSQDAFAELVERHASWIRAVCRRALRDRDFADDATQSVFIILARKASVISENTRVSGWLYRTTKFVISDLRKRETRHHRRQGLAIRAAIERGAEAYTHDPASSNGARETVAHILASLPEHERQAISMHFFDGLTFREIGEALGLSRDGAKKRVARAVARLRASNSIKMVLAATTAVIASIVKAPVTVQAALAATGKAMALTRLSKLIGANLAKLTALRAITASAMVATALAYGTQMSSQLRPRVPAPVPSSYSTALPYSAGRSLGNISPVGVAKTVAANTGVRSEQPIALASNTTMMMNPAISQSQRAPAMPQVITASASPTKGMSDLFVAPPTVEHSSRDRYASSVSLMSPSVSQSRAPRSDSDARPDRVLDSVASGPPMHHPIGGNSAPTGDGAQPTPTNPVAVTTTTSNVLDNSNTGNATATTPPSTPPTSGQVADSTDLHGADPGAGLSLEGHGSMHHSQSTGGTERTLSIDPSGGTSDDAPHNGKKNRDDQYTGDVNGVTDPSNANTSPDQSHSHLNRGDDEPTVIVRDITDGVDPMSGGDYQTLGLSETEDDIGGSTTPGLPQGLGKPRIIRAHFSAAELAARTNQLSDVPVESIMAYLAVDYSSGKMTSALAVIAASTDSGIRGTLSVDDSGGAGSQSVPSQSVPEPTSIVTIIGAAGASMLRRRKHG